MPKLPGSPDLARLAELTPEVVTLGTGTLLHRIYFKGGDHSTTWNQFRTFGPRSRFDHHQRDAVGDPCEQGRGVLYAARDVPTALAETFQRRRRIDRTNRQPWLASFRLAKTLVLLDLTGMFCVRAGASAKLATGPFRYAQNWASGFYDSYPQIAGLYYRSSLTNQPNVALYERGAAALPASTVFHRALADPAWHRALVVLAVQIGYEIL